MIQKIITGCLVISAAVAVFLNHEKISYIDDMIRVEMKEFFDPLIPEKNGNSNSKTDFDTRYIKSYPDLPDGFIRLDNIILYTPEKNISATNLSRALIELTGYYTTESFRHELLTANGISGNIISSGRTVYIPGTLPAVKTDLANHNPPEIPFTRGLYFPGENAGSRGFPENLPLLKEAGINTIVFDIKDVCGTIQYRSTVPLVNRLGLHDRRNIDNPEMLIRELKKHGFYVIARISVFHDRLLAQKSPNLAIRSASTGKIWRAGKEIWCDPTSKEVQNYNIDLAIEAARRGVDEIQFDYIRFPTDGNFSDALFRYDFGRMSRQETITGFLKRAEEALRPFNIRISIDTFGIVAWTSRMHLDRTGQNLETLAYYCDVISPMVYPSHFNPGFDGFPNPGDEPYHFVKTGTEKVIRITGDMVFTRPWLQAFGWRVKNYDENYILEQIRAAKEAGARGYLFWNAGGNYDTVIRALEKMKTRESG